MPITIPPLDTLKALGLTPITMPQVLRIDRQVAAAGTGQFDAIRFALGAEEQTGVLELGYSVWSSSGIVDGNVRIGAVINDPSETGTAQDTAFDNALTAFLHERRFELATEGAVTWANTPEAPGSPMLTLNDAQFFSFASGTVSDFHHELWYMYVRLTDAAFRAFLGRAIRG